MTRNQVVHTVFNSINNVLWKIKSLIIIKQGVEARTQEQHGQLV